MAQQKSEQGIASIIVVIAIIAVGLVAVGSYLLGKSDQTVLPTTQTKTEEVVLDDSTPASKMTFQQILKEFCHDEDLKDEKTGKSYGKVSKIDLDKLPLSFGQDLVIDRKDPLAVFCTNSEIDKGLVSIKYNADYRMEIYDKNSEDLGHDGPPTMGPFGAAYDDKSNPKLYVYLGMPSGGDSIVGEIPIYLRGLKEIKLKNGETIYVVTHRMMVDAADPKLIAFLKKHTDLKRPGENVLYGQGIDQTYVLEEMKQLSPAQKEAIDFVNSVLTDIKAK